MNAFYLVLGILLLTVAVADLLWTTLWVEGGAGPLTARLMAGTWALVRRLGRRSDRVRTLSGPLVLAFGLTVWIALLWAGWTLVFASGENALRDTVGGRSIDWPQLVYFTGFTMFTLGNGDFIPRGSVWQLVTTVVTASGMLFVTLSVTYVLSVLGAVTQKRAFASNATGLGDSGEDVVRTGWNGEEFRGLDVTLSALASELTTLTANHKAYPVLHYFHSGQSDRAPATGVAVLDEALTLLEFGMSEGVRPDEPAMTELRSSVDGFLGTLQDAFIEPADRTPPPPRLDVLRDAGIPTVADGRFRESVDDLDERRRTLLGLVQSDVRRWPSWEND